MEITLTLNGKKLTRSVEADTILLDFLRNEGCRAETWVPKFLGSGTFVSVW